MTTAGPAVRLEQLQLEDGVPMGAFATALRTGEGAALAFLPSPPRSDDEWRRYLETVAARGEPLPAALGEALARRQRVLWSGPVAEANARKLADPDTPALAVVTGQQPGLFGGPLLTYHKVAGAIALAARLDALGGPPVVPVFWSATEDHDFDEANQAAFVDVAGQVRVLKVDAEGDGRSIQDIDVPREAREAVLAELAALLPDTDRARAAAAYAAPIAEDDFAGWSARALLRVFGNSGIVVVEPHVLTPFAGESLAYLLDHAETIRSAVDACGTALRAADLPAPIAPQPDGATPLFYRAEAGGRRLRVGLRGDDRITLRDEPTELTRAALRERLLAEPASGSGNVIGRVFIQNRILPVLAYVAGPSEIAYHAQIRAAYEALDVPFPLALPRPEATWIDAKIQRDLDAFGLTVADVVRGAAEPARETDADLDADLDAMEAHLAALPAGIEARRVAEGRGGEAIERALARLRGEWAKARPRIRAALEADAGVGRARWTRLMNWLRPRGRPQERQLSPLALIARHGPGPVLEGLRSLDPLAPVHHVLRLGETDPA